MMASTRAIFWLWGISCGSLSSALSVMDSRTVLLDSNTSRCRHSKTHKRVLLIDPCSLSKPRGLDIHNAAVLLSRPPVEHSKPAGGRRIGEYVCHSLGGCHAHVLCQRAYRAAVTCASGCVKHDTFYGYYNSFCRLLRMISCPT